MSKEEVARRKPLTIGDVPSSEDPPAAVLTLNNAWTRDKAIDLWRAASVLFRSVDVWLQWLREFRETGDADPAVAMNLTEVCGAAITTLCVHAPSQFFRDLDSEDVALMLPPVPLRKHWQQDREFIIELAQRIERLRDLQGECSMVLSQLKQQPTAVIRQDMDTLPVVMITNSSGTIEFRGKTYEDIDPDACQLLQDLVKAYPERIGLSNPNRPKPARAIGKLPEAIRVIIDTNLKGSVLRP